MEWSGGRRLWIAMALLLLFGPGSWEGTLCLAQQTGKAASDSIAAWEGRTVRQIDFEGDAAARLKYLQNKLPQAVGTPLSREQVAASLRAVFATGVLDTAEVTARPDADGVDIIFSGEPRMFIGTVSVDGAKGATVNTQLERGSRLEAGSRFAPARMTHALELMRQVLAQNGYHEPSITYAVTNHTGEQLADIAFHVVSGPRARVGNVEVAGDSGMSLDEFRREAHLRAGALVDQETVNRALAGVLKYYRKRNRLEAEIKLESQSYAERKIDYRFTASEGPMVKVVLEGASLPKDRLQHLIPVFEEGTVDEDLLNEGNRHLRDYYQSIGYFDAKVDHVVSSPRTGEELIAYDVQLGDRGKVASVAVEGNHYFDAGTLKQLLNVHPATVEERHGAYSQALVTADVNALEAVYQNNGFAQVKVSPETMAMKAETASEGKQDGAAPIKVIYHIDEGSQQRVGAVRMEGNEHIPTASLQALMNTEAGQLLSPRSLAGDRDTLVTDYLSRGFEKAQVEVEEKNEAADASKVDVTFHITEGKQVFVRNVLLTGLHYTRPSTVARAITVHAGDPLNQTALEETQRNLYEFALFNEVNTAVQNPNGDETLKTILLQAVEARRWTLTYGAGFEVQTGTPVNGCQGLIASGVECTPSGRTGISPRGLIAITRNDLFGKEQSASIQGNYGLLEQKVDLIYQYPHLLGSRNFGFTFTGGYANSQDVTTYVASSLEAGFRVTQSFNRPGAGLSRANALIYGFDFRRVKVAEDSLQVYPDFVSTLAAAVRVGGPSFTWIRDTRDSAVDAHRGTYSSFQEFLSAAPFGAQAEFNRIDTSNSSFYGFDKDRFVLARNTRYGQERAFGSGSSELIPLPERLYAGGATSLRSFSINAAGPRDAETGYPIGGAGAFVNNLELRLPPPMLPYFGNTVSMVLFEDMGNIFNSSSDVWTSALHFKQPDRDACKTLNDPPVPRPKPGGADSSTGPQGNCSFNYFTHAPGLGLRYHTPVGPIRVDFSYTLNPPIFPVNINYSLKVPDSQPHVGEASHFNFFFSLGQTF
jgi:outer membrane protein assembly complex protein YaeT